ncbi:MAG: LytTR family DNA-binding domain-containing protein [Balneolaceae bacterium]|nr:LytTR family DNA-binding domain-containing protein [Balneolaceae bacterium]
MKSFDSSSSKVNRPSGKYQNRILVKSCDRKVFIEVDEIEWIESSGNYVKLNLRDNTYLVRGTLKKLENCLDPLHFVRIHRSCIVNINMVKEIEPWFSGDAKVILKNGESLKLSRNYKDNLERFKID